MCEDPVQGIAWLCWKNFKASVAGTGNKIILKKQVGLGPSRALVNIGKLGDFIPNSMKSLLRFLSRKTTKAVFHFRKITSNFFMEQEWGSERVKWNSEEKI